MSATVPPEIPAAWPVPTTDEERAATTQLLVEVIEAGRPDCDATRFRPVFEKVLGGFAAWKDPGETVSDKALVEAIHEADWGAGRPLMAAITRVRFRRDYPMLLREPEAERSVRNSTPHTPPAPASRAYFGFIGFFAVLAAIMTSFGLTTGAGWLPWVCVIVAAFCALCFILETPKQEYGSHTERISKEAQQKRIDEAMLSHARVARLVDNGAIQGRTIAPFKAGALHVFGDATQPTHVEIHGTVSASHKTPDGSEQIKEVEFMVWNNVYDGMTDEDTVRHFNYSLKQAMDRAIDDLANQLGIATGSAPKSRY